MKEIILRVSSVVLAAVSTLSNTALAQDIEQDIQPDTQLDIQQVAINSINHGGDGCPQGTLSGQISATQPDGLPDLLVIFFDAYEAIQGATVSPRESRKNCNIAINLEIPQGYQFSLFEAQYDGYADLPQGVSGVQRTTYSFPFTSSVTFETVLDGLYQDNYQRTDKVGVESVVWSPCGQIAPLTLRTSVALKGDQQPNASMSLDQITGKVTQLYGIQWRQCSP